MSSKRTDKKDKKKLNLFERELFNNKKVINIVKVGCMDDCDIYTVYLKDGGIMYMEVRIKHSLSEF